jgi:hypothetical protein
MRFSMVLVVQKKAPFVLVGDGIQNATPAVTRGRSAGGPPSMGR